MGTWDIKIPFGYLGPFCFFLDILVWPMTLVIGKDSWYIHVSMVWTLTHGIDMDSLYKHELMALTWTHGRDMESWYSHGLMV